MDKLLLLLIMLVLRCSPEEKIRLEVPRHRNPETPRQEILQRLHPIDFSSLSEHVSPLTDGTPLRQYSLKDTLYNGWALQVFTNNEHRYRYFKIEEGIVLWQIGYYDNGDLDHDFHTKGGKNYGSQRMWRKNQQKYIDNYFLEGGILHGLQYRWFTNDILAEESDYDHGQLIYKVTFDEDGKIAKREGKVPQKYEAK